MNIGALGPLLGSGVRAEITISLGLLGFTAMLGLLSWWDSPLIAWGMILTIFMEKVWGLMMRQN
jgi:hypothetical protein